MGIVYYSSKTTVLANLLFSRTKINHPPSSSGCCGKVRIWLEGVNKSYMEDVEIIDKSDGSYTATIIPQ